ncbi:retinoid-inducible serine carboxypeptidase-like [Amphiura filiformis]|uniref:retinoid-inducible serine carboxypeptidase-like n=1 Tax=Amphiura filiformis TaxID=82378 RepID=UPI003B20E2B5
MYNNMWYVSGLLLLLYCLPLISAKPAKGIPKAGNNIQTDEDWGYVNVREDAYMFWWLYYSTSEPYSAAPLVLWLQGGPGGSSCGFGNFEEIGPLDVELNPRNTTWISAANVLFIDNPVGAGYSYVKNTSALTKNNEEIANDLVTTISAFFKKLPKFQDIPFYIFSESYGGKMTAGFSKALLKAIELGRVTCNFQGFAMGDSWISPVDSTMTWGPYLYATSLLDHKGFVAVNQSATKTKEAFDAGNFTKSTLLWSVTEEVIDKHTNGVNFYNILQWNGESPKRRKSFAFEKLSYLDKLFQRHVQPLQSDDLAALMNGPIKEKLGIPDDVTWGGQSDEVFEALKEDFMKPVIDIVDDLVTNSDLSVVVYNGQLDLIVDTMGTERWVQKLTWPGLREYNNKTWTPLCVESAPETTAAFVKTLDNFSFYWILDAGHMIPSDQGEVALKMMKMVIGAK